MFRKPFECTTADCDVVVHDYCKLKLQTANGTKCPTCKTEWDVATQQPPMLAPSSRRAEKRRRVVVEDD